MKMRWNKGAFGIVLVVFVAIFLQGGRLVYKAVTMKERNATSESSDVGDTPTSNSSIQALVKIPKHTRHIQQLLANGSSNASQLGVQSILTPEEAAKMDEYFEAVESLQVYLDEGANEKALIEARRLSSSDNRNVRLAALEAMQCIGSAAAADIVPFIGDPDSEIRQTADEAFWAALDELNDSALKVQMISTALQSSNPSWRMDALDRLLFLPDQLSVPVLATMLNDADGDVQSLARENLEFITEETFQSEQEAIAWYRLHKSDLEAREMDSL